MIWQAARNVAARRPMRETRNNWLSLLNFMRFLRRGPFASSPLQLVDLSRIHFRSRSRVLRICDVSNSVRRAIPRPLPGAPDLLLYFVAVPPCGIAAMAVG